MNGVLLLDKPARLTSHDVVAWARRRLGQRDIGHAGTLDPLATGLLVLLVGKGTRLSSLLTGKDKAYEATVRLGFGTTTDDADGEPLAEPAATWPATAAVQSVIESFIGTFEQLPPAHSAKKISGVPAYKLARRQQPTPLKPATVTLHSVEWLGGERDVFRFRLTVSAGFYVRSLARDLGQRLGCGGHLAALRRTRSGHFDVREAISLAEADDPACDIESRLISLAGAIPDVPAVQLTPRGLARVLHGNFVGPTDCTAGGAAGAGWTRLLAEDGRLAALGQWRDGVLHPVMVLG